MSRRRDVADFLRRRRGQFIEDDYRRQSRPLKRRRIDQVESIQLSGPCDEEEDKEVTIFGDKRQGSAYVPNSQERGMPNMRIRANVAADWNGKAPAGAQGARRKLTMTQHNRLCGAGTDNEAGANEQNCRLSYSLTGRSTFFARKASEIKVREPHQEEASLQ